MICNHCLSGLLKILKNQEIIKEGREGGREEGRKEERGGEKRGEEGRGKTKRRKKGNNITYAYEQLMKERAWFQMVYEVLRLPSWMRN